MKVDILDLGVQPIANSFLESEEDFQDEYFYHLKLCYDDETHLISISEFVPPEKMFHDKYAYHASLSTTMRDHFKDAASKISNNLNFDKLLEIGSNDGVFLRHFSTSKAIAVEPCGNFSNMTNTMGYRTYCNFWTEAFSQQLLQKEGNVDVLFAANCMSHVQDLDDTFKAISNNLDEDGFFIMETFSLYGLLKNNLFDNIYHEHISYFSTLSLKKFAIKFKLQIVSAEELKVKGGSIRFIFKKTNKRIILDDKTKKYINKESTLINYPKSSFL